VTGPGRGEHRELAGWSPGAEGVTLSRDGRHLAQADAGGGVLVGRTDGGTPPVVTAVDLEAADHPLAFSPDARHLAVLGADRYAVLDVTVPGPSATPAAR